jgi:hypothetical protein
LELFILGIMGHGREPIKNPFSGIATGSINELKNPARQRAAYIIYVQADKADEAALKGYEALGGKKAVALFRHASGKTQPEATSRRDH